MNENLLKIPSERKRAAARANGAKAKGMKTPAGKARSALNVVTHGLTAKTPFLLQNESQKNWDGLYDAYSGGPARHCGRGTPCPATRSLRLAPAAGLHPRNRHPRPRDEQ